VHITVCFHKIGDIHMAWNENTLEWQTRSLDRFGTELTEE